MPQLTYAPEGADPKVWDLDFGKLLSPERIAIEKMTGLGWRDVQKGFYNDAGVVMHALLYILLKRDRPTLQPKEVVFASDDITSDITDDEAHDILETLRAQESLDDDELEVLAELEARFAKSDPDEEGPKEASTNESESTT